MRNKRIISLSFILSLLLHVGLGTGAILAINPIRLPEKPEAKPVELELVDAEQIVEQMKKHKVEAATKGQIVDQDEKQLNDEVPVDARFLSRHNQKVVRETQAQLHGKFKNSDTTGGERALDKQVGKESEKISEQKPAEETKDKTDEQPEKKIADEKFEDLSTSGQGVAVKSKPLLKDLVPSFKPAMPTAESQELAKGGGEGASATDDHLKNVQTGMQTLLSTREFVYFSYYNRIKDKLRQYWEPKIKEKMERIIRQGRTIASQSDRITRIVIILDNKGTLMRVQVVGPSGVSDLDEAAVEAFRAAAPFPNPPKGIEEADGTIKIRWDFILEANAGGFLDAMRVARASGV